MGRDGLDGVDALEDGEVIEELDDALAAACAEVASPDGVSDEQAVSSAATGRR